MLKWIEWCEERRRLGLEIEGGAGSVKMGLVVQLAVSMGLVMLRQSWQCQDGVGGVKTASG